MTEDELRAVIADLLRAVDAVVGAWDRTGALVEAIEEARKAAAEARGKL